MVSFSPSLGLGLKLYQLLFPASSQAHPATFSLGERETVDLVVLRVQVNMPG